MTTHSKTERKLGARILATVAEIQATPKDNVQRFTILRRRLVRYAKAYREFTGSDRLEHPVEHYGFKNETAKKDHGDAT